MTPGATQLTRMPLGATSSASERVSPISACLVQEYGTSHDAPCCPHMDEMFTMQPLFSCSMPGSTARMVLRAPFKFTPK